jgi:signal transduction histidine kinase
MTNVRQRLSLYAAYVFAWTLVALFFFSQALARRVYLNQSIPWREMLAGWLIGIYITAVLALAVLWLGRRWPIERSVWVRRVALHLVCSAIFSVVQLALETAAYHQLGLFTTPERSAFLERLPAALILGFHGNVTTYWIVLGIQWAFDAYRRYQERAQQALRLELHASELRSQVMRAQLSALKMQLQPHFLFNTLNAITTLVRQKNERDAETMLGLLSDLLRRVLADVDVQEVPLRSELESLQVYLSIEKVRFPDRLRVEIDIDPAILDAAVPHMGLQPIVENAVRHGISRRLAASTIRISARRDDAVLRLTVQDDGPGLPDPATPEAEGIGLSNTRARLRQLYGDSGMLTLGNDPGGGAVVTMLLPYHPVDQDHAADHTDRR